MYLYTTTIKSILFSLLLISWNLASARYLPIDSIKLPPGFKISTYAELVPGARTLVLAPNGVLFVSTRNNGKVYAVIDSNQDYIADEVKTIASDLNMPNGIDFKDGSLYVAEVHQILRFDNILEKLDNPDEPRVINEDLPIETHHGWRYMRFGPDGKLYVAVGAPCNICLEPDYAEIKYMDLETASLESFAYGVRNSVGFDWHPETGHLWFTDNGRDWLGDELPPDELNTAPRKGMHFGYPYCHGDDFSDPEYGQMKACSEITPPVQKLGAHVASLGMRFYTGNMFPEEYRNQVFIAEHGSWNRSTKVGYRISLVRLKDNKSISYEPFATGWLKDEQSWGRPVDVLVMPDGSLLVSDDKAGVIYRITYEK